MLFGAPAMSPFSAELSKQKHCQCYDRVVESARSSRASCPIRNGRRMQSPGELQQFVHSPVPTGAAL